MLVEYPFYVVTETALLTFRLPAKWADKMSYVMTFSQFVRGLYLKETFSPAFIQKHHENIMAACDVTVDVRESELGFYITFRIVDPFCQKMEMTTLIFNDNTQNEHNQREYKRGIEKQIKELTSP